MLVDLTTLAGLAPDFTPFPDRAPSRKVNHKKTASLTISEQMTLITLSHVEQPVCFLEVQYKGLPDSYRVVVYGQRKLERIRKKRGVCAYAERERERATSQAGQRCEVSDETESHN
jgi:hypothetical protein